MAAAAGTPELERSVVDRGDATLLVVRSPGPNRGSGRVPLLFVHGYPDTHATWQYQLAELGAEHPVAAFDLRGVGGSQIVGEPAAATRMERYVGDIEAVIDHVAGPAGQVHLVAHDWGGALAWLFAAQCLTGLFSATHGTAYAYVTDVTPAPDRPRRFGMIGASFGLGFVIGPAIGGLLGELGPRVPFWVAAGVSLLNFVYGIA